jgi:hypothetical protein
MADYSGMNIADLIAARRNGRSYAQLVRDSGGVMKASAWNAWGKADRANERGLFPEPASIRAMALALGVSHTDIILAVARTLGLTVASDDPSELRIAGGGLLPEQAQQTLLNMARSMQLLASTAG